MNEVDDEYARVISRMLDRDQREQNLRQLRRGRLALKVGIVVQIPPMALQIARGSWLFIISAAAAALLLWVMHLNTVARDAWL